MYLIEMSGKLWFSLGEDHVLGSDEQAADLHFLDESVSGAHAALRRRDGEWWIEDLESEDGTYLNGEELSPGHAQKLTPGARVGIGLCEFLFSARGPLKTADAPAFAAAATLAFDDDPDHAQQLTLLRKLGHLLQFSSDIVAFLEPFLELLEEIFAPSALVLAIKEELLVRGAEEARPLVEWLVHQARYRMEPLAFCGTPPAVGTPAVGTPEVGTPAVGTPEAGTPEAGTPEAGTRESTDGECSSYQAFYAPLLLDELVQGYLCLLSPEGAGWSLEAYQLFSVLSEFVSKGLGASEMLHRAQEDREVLHLNLVGVAPEMQRLKTELIHLAQSDIPVVVCGEQGVGKTRIARAIHQASLRRQAPLMVLNAANFPKELFEMEICGAIQDDENHVRSREGKLALADGGTFLLEEIGEIPLGIQPTLLSILSSRKYTPVGASEPRSANVRMLFTSQTPLRELLKEDRLIPELAGLLQTLHVPSLRQRKEDLPQLFRAFLGRFGEEEGLPSCVVSDEAILRLNNHRWTYNIRELRDIVARCFYELDPEHPVVDVELIERVLEAHKASQEIEHQDLLGQQIQALEHRLIQEALMAANDDLSEAAKALGISRVVLWRKMRALAIG